MFKKEFGVSIYPEHTNLKEIKAYLTKAKKCGFTRVFLSWIHWLEPNKYQVLYIETIKLVKDLGFYLVLDICDNNFEFYKQLKVDCVRLDSPVMPKEVADLTYETNLDIQLNISNNDHFINNVLDFQPVKENLYGCHNFYFRQGSGLGWNLFKESTKKFNDLGIHTSAFINSQTATYGAKEFPFESGASTIEELRFLPLHSQAKYLLATKQIDAIYIANQFASDEELESIRDIDKKQIELDLLLTKELQNLEQQILFDKHFDRGDFNKSFIRSTMSRVNYQKKGHLLPDTHDQKIATLHKGDVIIINSNDMNYEKELNIIRKDFEMPANNFNYLGRIATYDQGLIDLIEPWQHFSFKVIKEGQKNV